MKVLKLLWKSEVTSDVHNCQNEVFRERPPALKHQTEKLAADVMKPSEG